jgi:rhodanese-related sulfurtransferase
MPKRTCITCEAKGVDKDKTPLWSKKDGLYSMLPRILNCGDKYNPHKTELEESTPEIVGTELTFEIELQEKDNWIFYWAAEAGASLDGDKPEGAAKSYGDESNHGLSKLDADGKATITLNCPKLYMEDDTLFPRHVHYTILTKDRVWSTNMGTYEITCKIPFETMKEIQEKRTYIIMNALSKEAYDEGHIPNSILCHHESLEGLSNKQKKTGILKKLINQNLSAYPPVKKFNRDVGDIKQVPIVVYCANSKCNASDKLKEHLYSCGFFNVIEYPGGMEEWLQKSNTTSLFEDAAASEEEGLEVEELEEEIEEDGGPSVELDEDEQEFYIYDGVTYIHNFEDDEILDIENLEPVGVLESDEIVWNNPKEYQNHVQRKAEKGGLTLDDEDDEDDKDDQKQEEDDEEKDEEQEEEEKTKDDEETDEEEQEDKDEEEQEDETPLTVETSDEEEEDSSDEHNESSLNSQNTTELKRLFDKVNNMNKKEPKKKKDFIRCILDCEKSMKGGGPNDSILYGGGVTQSMYENSFRGWGFTFNM